MLLLSSNSISGQNIIQSDSAVNAKSKSGANQNTPSFDVQKLHYSFDFGAGYMSGFGSFSKISPSVNYQFSLSSTLK